MRVEQYKEVLELCDDNPRIIFDGMVTGWVAWVHHYNSEGNQEWHKKGIHPPKKFKITPFAAKLMATIF